MNQKRSYSLDVLKLFLAYVVAFGHAKMAFRPGSTVSVQIFFIISGFFLARKFYAREETYSAWNYTLDHVRSIYPHYVFSCGVLFVYVASRNLLELVLRPSWYQFRECLVMFYDQLPDIFLLQSAYHWHDSLNYPLWQISALLIAGYFVFALLRRDEKLALTILFPAAIFMGMSLMVGKDYLFANVGPVYLPLIRAFYPMCVGVYTWRIVSTPAYEALKRHRKTFDAAALLFLASMIWYAERGNIFLITVPILILNCWDDNSALSRLFRHRIFGIAGRLSYAIYLNHALVARVLWALIVPRVPMSRGVTGLVYFLMMTLYSLLTLRLVDWLTKKLPIFK